MSSRLAMMLAMVLLIAAAVAGYFAWTLSQPQQSTVVVSEEEAQTDGAEKDEADTAEEAPTFAVVFARNAIDAGSTISDEQLIVHSLPVQPPQTFAEPEALTGARVWRDIEAGEMLRAGHLRQGSDLATTLLPEERAMAVSIDAVIGTGGLPAPGDSVDVLLYLREIQDRSPSAQVVLEDVRLLSFAERVQPPPDRATEEEEPERTEFRDKTAVLAVPRQDMTRLMLASQAGTLRLALRSAAQPPSVIQEGFSITDELATELPPEADEDSKKLVQLSEFLPEPEQPDPRPQPQSPPQPEKQTIPIHRGGATETVELPQP